MFFNAVREGDLVVFASDDEQDRMLWVQAMYRATGQSYKPVPPLQNKTSNSRGRQKPASPISKYSLDQYVQSFIFIQTEESNCQNDVHLSKSIMAPPGEKQIM